MAFVMNVSQNILRSMGERMKAKTRFMKHFYRLPEEARINLVYRYRDKPMSLNVCASEIRNDTELGKQILSELGYEDD